MDIKNINGRSIAVPSIQESNVLALLGLSIEPREPEKVTADLDLAIDALEINHALDGGKLRLLELVRGRAASLAGLPARPPRGLAPYSASSLPSTGTLN